ncbi:hypothetical protein Trydic_g15555 [Trypoxylus dichotomus]
MLKTKASRDSHQVESRFRSQAEKAYERYKITKELEETQRLKEKAAKSQKITDLYTDAKGMYIIEEAKRSDTVEDGDGDAEGSLHFLANMKATIGKGTKAFFKNMYTDTKFELKWHEFMCITFYLQVPLAYMIRHITMIHRWGAFLVLVVYVIIGACITMPVYMILMFMGNYGRKSYVRFWECVPILKGVAYSIFITTIVQELANITFAAFFFDYFFHSLFAKTTPWADCNFKYHSNTCVYVPPQGGYNETCCLRGSKSCSEEEYQRNMFNYAAFDYLKIHQRVSSYNIPKTGKLDLRMAAALTTIWLLILFVLLIGLKKVRTIMTTLNILLVVLLIPLFVATLFWNHYGMFAEFDTNFASLLDYRFWVEVCTFSLHRELAGDVITFSAMSSPGISTTVDTLCIYTIKFMFLSLLTVWTSIGLTMLQQYYNVKDPKCIDVDGFVVLYSVFPEIISQTRFGKPLLCLYYLAITYWCFSVSIYTLNSFIGALFEEYPKLVKLKILFCSALCVGCGTTNYFILQNDVESLYNGFYTREYIEMKVILVFATLLGIYLYSLTRLCNDYHFTYGQKLSVFWIHGVKIAMMLIVSLGLLRLFIQYNSLKTSHLLPLLLTLVPIVIGGVIAVLKFQTGKRATLISPDPQWGPPTLAERRARRKFDPKRNLRYKSTIQKCKHACLLGAASVDREAKYWNNKRFSLYGVKID